MVKNALKAIDCLSRNLRLIREAKGLSLSQLAEMSGLSKQSIWNFENGARFPSSEAIASVCESLKIEETDLFDPKIKIITKD